MPTATIYSSEQKFQDSLLSATTELRVLLAKELTCGSRFLETNEISVRLLSVAGQAMIAPIEIDITAHAYPERTKRADKICLIVREFVKKQVPEAKDVRVWLILCELGHSWEE